MPANPQPFWLTRCEQPDQHRANIVRIARTWERTPFHQNAAVRGVGVDCGRMCAAVYIEAGLLKPEVMDKIPRLAADWCRHTSEEAFLGLIRKHLRQVATPLPGDMALFQLERIFAHSAIVIDWPLILHVCRHGLRVSLADATQEPLLKRRPVKFFSAIK